MKNSILWAVIVCLSAVSVQIVQAQWVQTNGPYGGNITALAITGSDIFAGTLQSGVYRSSDNGTRWIPANNGLTDHSIIAQAMLGGEVFVGTYSGLFRSSNGGADWVPAGEGLGPVYSIAARGTDLYAAIDGGVFSSSDRGDNWTFLSLDLPSSPYLLAAHDTCLIAANIFGVYRTTNNGATWTTSHNGLLDTHVNGLAVLGSNFLVGTESRGVFLSSSSGDSWIQANNGLPDTSIAMLGVAGADLYAATKFNQNVSSSLFRSTDNGTTWNPVNTGYLPGFPFSEVTAVADNGTHLFVGMNGIGVLRSTDHGNQWTSVSNGLEPSGALAFAVLGTEVLAASPAEGLFSSTDGGNTWVPHNSGLKDGYLEAIAVNGADIFLATYNSLYRSTDAGDHWTSVGTDMLDVSALAILNPYVFAAIPEHGVFRSSDRGEHWAQVNDGLTNRYVLSLAVLGADLFAAAGDGVYRSTNGGDTWTPASNGLLGQFCYDLVVGGSDLYVGVSEGLFVSTNSGAEWIPIHAGLPHIYTLPLVGSGQHLIVANGDDALFRTSDHGTTWIPIDQGLNVTTIASLAVVGPDLYLGTWGEGIWKRPLSELTSIEPVDGKVPSEFSLLQNYPNPFNPSTTVRYGLPSRSHVTLTVYNTLGQQVATLVQGEQEAGFHEVQFDASGLASGIYLYRLQAGDFVYARKLVVVK